MLLRFDTANAGLWLTTSQTAARRHLADRTVGGADWSPLTPMLALELLHAQPDRVDTLHTLRDALAGDGMTGLSILSDMEIFNLAADRLGHGWAVTVERQIPSGGWASGGAPTAPVVSEAVEPPAYATGVPAQKDLDHFIIVELVGENGEPIPGELCRITLPDGVVVERDTNSQGRVEEYNIPAGTCDIEFPDLDKDAWDSVAAMAP